MQQQRFVGLAFFIFACSLNAADLTATVGKQTVVIPDGKFGFHYFPDQAVTVISRKPLRFTVVADKTYLLEGETFETAKPVTALLEASRISGAFDEQYAGINSVFNDNKRKELLGFFHAERPTGGKNQHGFPIFMQRLG